MNNTIQKIISKSSDCIKPYNTIENTNILISNENKSSFSINFNHKNLFASHDYLLEFKINVANQSKIDIFINNDINIHNLKYRNINWNNILNKSIIAEVEDKETSYFRINSVNENIIYIPFTIKDDLVIKSCNIIFYNKILSLSELKLKVLCTRQCQIGKTFSSKNTGKIDCDTIMARYYMSDKGIKHCPVGKTSNINRKVLMIVLIVI